MLGIGLCKVSARRKQYKIKSQGIFIFIAEPQPNFAKQSSARREQYKIKSQEIFIFIAEPQPNLACAKLVFFYESIPSCPHFLHTK